MTKRFIILFIIGIVTLIASAQNDTVSVTDSMTIVPKSLICETKDIDRESSVDIQQTITPDSLIKKTSWLRRVYNFANNVLSPPRDSNYIDVQDYYNWQAMVQVTTRFELFNINASDKLQLIVSPEWRTRIGPFFGWRFLFLGYNIDIKSIFMNGDDTDLGASIYSSAFGLDLFYRRVGGQYKISKLKYNDFDYTSQLQGHNFDGINVGMTRISFYYICNYKHYSHQAAFNQVNRQKRSAGSLILGAQYAHNKSSFNWNKLAEMVNSKYRDNTIEPPTYSNIRNNEYSLTCGYGYNWVFYKNWLAAGEIAGAFGYLVQKEKIEKEDKNEYSDNLLKRIENFGRKNIAFNSNLRLSILYNNGPWFAGTQAVIFYYQHGNGNVLSRNLLGCLYAYVGFNF